MLGCARVLQAAVKAHRAAIASRQFDNGFSWAAGELLSRRLSVNDVELRVEDAKSFDAYHDHHFDRGALAACRCWEKLTCAAQ